MSKPKILIIILITLLTISLTANLMQYQYYTKNLNQKIEVEKQNQEEEPKNIIPFGIEAIETITLHKGENGEKIDADLEDGDKVNLIYQSIYHLNTNLKANVDLAKLSTAESVNLRFNLHNGINEYKYYYAINTIEIDGNYYHPTEELYLIINSILNAEALISDIYKLQMASHKEFIQNKVEINENFRYDFARLDINGKDYNMWERELEKLTPIKTIPYYADYEEKIREMKIYEEGIVMLDSIIFFTNNNYRTSDGITIGTTKQEVIKLLGEPNSKTNDVWKYKEGDYLKFHLYFKDGKVKYIGKSMPL